MEPQAGQLFDMSTDVFGSRLYLVAARFTCKGLEAARKA